MRAPLLAWFAANARDLPWREPEDRHDPYRVLVAEVMLQQTRVATAIPYYRSWLERFPDLRALAEADEDAVLRAWQGLGYYRRALDLRRAAREVAERFGGDLPGDRRELERLPGVGPYTAAAVAALAFGRSGVAVDANVRRVAARLNGWERPPADAEVERALLARFGAHGTSRATPGAQGTSRATPGAPRADGPPAPDGTTAIGTTPDEGIPNQGIPNEAAAFAEALIELGALVCTPAAPACGRCPLAPGCVAAAEGAPERYPARVAQRAPPLRRRYALVALDERHVWLTRRQPGELLGGLWGFPQVDAPPRGGRRLEPVRHAYSHFRLELIPVLLASGHPALAADAAVRPHALSALDALALSAVDLRVLARLSDESLLPRPAKPSPGP